MTAPPLTQASIVEVLLRAVAELKLCYEEAEDGDHDAACTHYDRAAGLLLTLGIDIDVVEELV